MDDRLEKFIKSHREEMDVKNPRRDLWSDIESQLGGEPKQRRLAQPVMFWRAAAVILLLLSSWLVFDKDWHPPDKGAFKTLHELAPFKYKSKES